MTRTLAALCTLAVGLTIPALAQQNITPEQKKAIDAVVQNCINQVRGAGYSHFDAFYNAASGHVENNVTMNMEAPALFQFNKCMASQGLPLKYGDK